MEGLWIDRRIPTFQGPRLNGFFSREFRKGSGYGYGTVPGGRWTIDTEGGHVVVSVSLIRNGYEYGRRSRGRFRIPRARDSGYEYGRRSRGFQVDHWYKIGDALRTWSWKHLFVSVLSIWMFYHFKSTQLFRLYLLRSFFFKNKFWCPMLDCRNQTQRRSITTNQYVCPKLGFHAHNGQFSI